MIQLDPSRTWVTADSHFGHNNIVGFCHRPPDHEEIMLDEWLDAVPPHNSTLLHLGDLCYKRNAEFKHVVAPKLTGERKLLVLGNHDRQRKGFYRACGFEIVRPFEILWENADYPRGAYVTFDHYPRQTAPSANNVHVHGHIHNNGYAGKDGEYAPFAAGQINVSVEQTHYQPVNLGALLRGYFVGSS